MLLMEYDRMTLAQMQKKRWKTKREMKTSQIVIPAGTEVLIYHKRGGLGLEGTAPCSCCGVKVRIHGVAPGEVEEVLE